MAIGENSTEKSCGSDAMALSKLATNIYFLESGILFSTPSTMKVFHQAKRKKTSYKTRLNRHRKNGPQRTPPLHAQRNS